MEVEVNVKHILLNNGGLGLLRFEMLLSRTAKHTSSVIEAKARKSYSNKRPHDYLVTCQLTERLDTPS